MLVNRTATARALMLSACCTLILNGCGSDTESKYVDTKNIKALYEITESNSNVDVVASFREDTIGTDPDIKLTSGDRVVVITPGSVRSILSRSGNEYKISIGNPVSGEYRIELDRSNDTDANNSRVTMPSPLAMTEPVAGTNIDSQSQQAIPIRWSQATTSTTAVTINFTFKCSEGGATLSDSKEVSDGGQYIYDATTFLSSADACTGNRQLTTELVRINRGIADNNLASESSITAIQKESATVTLL